MEEDDVDKQYGRVRDRSRSTPVTSNRTSNIISRVTNSYHSTEFRVSFAPLLSNSLVLCRRLVWQITLWIRFHMQSLQEVRKRQVWYPNSCTQISFSFSFSFQPMIPLMMAFSGYGGVLLRSFIWERYSIFCHASTVLLNVIEHYWTEFGLKFLSQSLKASSRFGQFNFFETWRISWIDVSDHHSCIHVTSFVFSGVKSREGPLPVYESDS